MLNVLKDRRDKLLHVWLDLFFDVEKGHYPGNVDQKFSYENHLLLYTADGLEVMQGDDAQAIMEYLRKFRAEAETVFIKHGIHLNPDDNILNLQGKTDKEFRKFCIENKLIEYTAAEAEVMRSDNVHVIRKNFVKSAINGRKAFEEYLDSAVNRGGTMAIAIAGDYWNECVRALNLLEKSVIQSK